MKWFKIIGVLIVIAIIVVMSVLIKVNIDTKNELELVKSNYSELEDKITQVETNLNKFEDLQNEKNNAYEVMFESQGEINESTSDLMKLMLGY